MHSTVRFASLVAVLAVLISPFLIAQELLLKYTFTRGERLRYQLSYTSSREGSPGKAESFVLLYYSLTIQEVNSEGTATATFMQDSVRFWEDKQEQVESPMTALNGVPITVQISARGHLLDWQYPSGAPGDVERSASKILSLFMMEPPLPGTATEVGSEWKNDVTLNFWDVEATAMGSITSKFSRLERTQGKPLARIDYRGTLTGSGKGGNIRGTILFNPESGKRFLHTQEYDIQLFLQTREGRTQTRLRTRYTLELLP